MKYYMPNTRIKSKVRGLKRKSFAMIKNIVDQTQTFPEEDRPNCGYWHLHVPVAQEFIDSIHTPQSVRRLCVQTLVDRVEHLKSVKPKSDREIRVVACIGLPNLWNSQVVVFFGDEYFSNFFARHTCEQSWEALPQGRSIAEEFKLAIPEDATEKGFSEHVQGEDWKRHGELWFIGELK